MRTYDEVREKIIAVGESELDDFIIDWPKDKSEDNINLTLMGMDSLDVIEYAMAIEDACEIIISDKQLGEVTKFEDLVNLVMRLWL